MKLELHDGEIACPGCGESLGLPLRARTEGPGTVLVTVDHGPVRAHVAERHPEVLARYDEALAAEAVAT